MTMNARIIVATPILDTPRVQQARGMFDLPIEEASRLTWDVTLPLHEQPWHIGLIVGPSGCGKSTLAQRLWPEATQRCIPGGAALPWSRDRSILDDFPPGMAIKEVIELLCSVGFCSPPAWLRPFHVLSTGQQFRVLLARLLAEASAETEIVFDEFTSVVDRTVAQLGSAALARTLRRRGQRFVALTCHEDVADWLQPDWIYRPAGDDFQWRCLRRRPAIELDIARCRPAAWASFAPHHYLSRNLSRAAVCFLATWQGRPVAFSAWINQFGAGRPSRREHRTVTLPDYQGVGIGTALSNFVASLWRALGYRALSTTTHPALIASRARSPLWRMHRTPSLMKRHEPGRHFKHALTRLTAGFTYVGPALERALAVRLLETTHGKKAAAPDGPAYPDHLQVRAKRRLRTDRL
jgi:GNAT superfamily N-acetyltransferase